LFSVYSKRGVSASRFFFENSDSGIAAIMQLFVRFRRMWSVVRKPPLQGQVQAVNGATMGVLEVASCK
jgi:hypothetical protein